MRGCEPCEEGPPVSGTCTLRCGGMGPRHHVLFRGCCRKGAEVSLLCWGHSASLGLVLQGQRSPAPVGCHLVLVASSTGVSKGCMLLFLCSLDWGGNVRTRFSVCVLVWWPRVLHLLL